MIRNYSKRMVSKPSRKYVLYLPMVKPTRIKYMMPLNFTVSGRSPKAHKLLTKSKRFLDIWSLDAAFPTNWQGQLMSQDRCETCGRITQGGLVLTLLGM